MKAGELACPPVSTDESGKGQTPPLYIGIYTITETVAPAGYTLDATPHDAVVAYKDQHTAIVFSTESIANTAQKGVIEVEKQDAESGLPVLMSDAAFEVSAAEDIITPDGTLRACAGDIVDTIETDETGHAHTKALYLGKYTVREISAPAGYILTDEVKEVELVYGDQTEPVVYSSTFLANMPVKGVVSIHKEDGAQNIPLADVEYELRAAENIITGDDTVHHKAGDVVAILKTDKNGNASVGGIYLGEYVLVETVQPDGYELDEKEYPVHLEYAGQDVPEVSFENTFYNTPASVVIKKVSTSDDSLVVPDTKFVGWLADNEVALDEPFAVFADKDIDIVSASIEYLGEFSTSNIDVVEDTFELSVKEVEGAYTVLVADKKPAQGDYTLHLTYRNDRQDRDVSVPFVINEYDANAYFAIGQDIVIDDADDETASSFARIRDMKAAYDAGLGGGHGDADDGDDNSEDNGSAGNENDNAGEDNLPEDRPDSGVADDNANVVSPLVALEEGTDEGEGVVDGDNEAETETPDGTPDDTEELPDGDMPNAGDDENNDTDIEDTKCEVSISRVPAVLSKGGFALSCTDDKGIATFTYVLQGKWHSPNTSLQQDMSPIELQAMLR